MIVTLSHNEETEEIKGLKNETIIFHGVFSANTVGVDGVRPVRNRAHLLFRECENLTIYSPIIDGPHKDGGLSNSAYVGKYEAQHGIEFIDCKNIEVVGANIRHVYGDGVYMINSDGIRLDNHNIQKQGRQGVAIVNSKNILIENGHQSEIRRSHFDLENNYDTQRIENVTIRNMRLGNSRLGVFTNSGPGVTDGFYVLNNKLYDSQLWVWIGNWYTSIGDRKNIKIIGNTSNRTAGDSTGGIMKFYQVKNLLIEDNVAMSDLRGMRIAKCFGCENVFLGKNEVINGINELLIA